MISYCIYVCKRLAFNLGNDIDFGMKFPHWHLVKLFLFLARIRFPRNESEDSIVWKTYNEEVCKI